MAGVEEVVQNGKCCAHCACRRRSPERQDVWGWIRLIESWDEWQPFFCHESIPGHSMEVVDDRPRYRVCAGYLALRDAPTKAQMRHVEEIGMAEALIGCGIEYAAMVLEHHQARDRGEVVQGEPSVPAEIVAMHRRPGKR
mgnify:FL=1